jgi:serine-type D-Ala-D-Ala carboxypeptidase/endopeptidase
VIRTISAIAVAMALSGTIARTQTLPPPSLPSEAEVRTMLKERVDVLRQATGIVVGIVGPNFRRIVAYGTMGRDDPRPVDGDTVFEIGSLTKVFTSMLLAGMVERGEVSLSDPVAKYLPKTVKMPLRGGRTITLVDLATHTSGLPRLPSNMHPRDPANPYAGYSLEDLCQFLSNYTLTREIGSKYEYSTLGVGLLGAALARRAGMPYEALLESRISDPLEMTGTRITLSRNLESHLARGHDALLAPMPRWDWEVLAGAGALKSSANDLLKLLVVHLGYVDSPLASTAASMLGVRRATGAPGVEVALGWHIVTSGRGEIVVHDGGTFGYRSFAGFNPKRRVGIVVLSNAFTFACCNDLGEHLLDPVVPPAKSSLSDGRN